MGANADATLSQGRRTRTGRGRLRAHGVSVTGGRSSLSSTRLFLGRCGPGIIFIRRGDKVKSKKRAGRFATPAEQGNCRSRPRPIARAVNNGTESRRFRTAIYRAPAAKQPSYAGSRHDDRIIRRRLCGVSTAVEKPRQVARRFLARPQHEGVGAVVRRSIGRFELRYFDPFLVLDEFSVSAPAGFPDHPHRGFETVTYMLEGAVTHEDFEGHRGTIKAGDVQWMTAGRGIVHSEMPAAPGTSRGLQLWVNLSSQNKMIEPRYQEIQSKDIASTTSTDGGVTVRVVAGQAMGARSPVSTRTPTMYLDFTVRARAAAPARQPVPPSWNAFVYVLEGEAVFGGAGAGEKAVPAHHLALLAQGGDGVEVWNRADRPLRFLLVAGEPIGEPVAQLGPFVMNTEEEIDAAVNDFEYCINGFEKAKHWKSQAMMALDDVE